MLVSEMDLVDFFLKHEKIALYGLGGMGTKASQSIVEARKDGIFTSIEDLRRRTGISKTNIEILRDHGCLDGMGESDQISLFG